MARPKYARLLSPPTAHPSYTRIIGGAFCLFFQPPDVPGPHLVRLHDKAHVRQHGTRLWVFSPKGFQA